MRKETNKPIVLNKADKVANIKNTEIVLSRCRATMISPKMMHFIVEYKESELPSKIIQPIKEAYVSEFKKFEKDRFKRLRGKNGNAIKVRKRQQPKLEIIYSIESKMLGEYKYDHIHFMFIVDFGHNRFDYKEIISIINNALLRLSFVVPIVKVSDFKFVGHNGVNACGYLRYRDFRSTVKADDAQIKDDGFIEIRGHDLKTEFDDAMIRASYLCKSSQKELLPTHIKNMSFNHTRASRKSCNDEFMSLAS